MTALVKRPSLANGQQRVNLVHKEDVISVLVQILTTDFNHVVGRTLHLCAPEHPTRRDYYQAAAQHKGLGTLSFTNNGKADDGTAAEGKIVLAQKTQQWLGFKYQYSSPYDML